MRVLDLFSGIGGFSLGLERAGFTTAAFCECDPYCQRVLRRHWPDVPVYDDVRELTAAQLRADDISVNVVAGGFPCQDVSIAGKGAGITGERSGLWREYARIIGEVRPRYAIVENVSALLHRGLADVLGDLSEIGYDAEWHCIPASAVGAPHRRDRVWIVAYPRCFSGDGRGGECGRPESAGPRDRPARSGQHAVNVADAGCPDVEGQWLASRIQQERNSSGCPGWWLAEPDVGRVAVGIPSRVDRLRALGNSVVPQVVEIIGRAIMKEITHGR